MHAGHIHADATTPVRSEDFRDAVAGCRVFRGAARAPLWICWRDRLDHSSAAPGASVMPTNQVVGIGDGVTATFQLGKTKPVLWSIRVAVAETEADEGTQFIVNVATGIVTFLPNHIPAAGVAVTAGFLFDVPVRFDTN